MSLQGRPDVVKSRNRDFRKPRGLISRAIEPGLGFRGFGFRVVKALVLRV